MELSERIYQLRKEKNMTQQDLADQLGVSRQAVSRWEMGTANPEIESLTAMSRIFNLTLDELVTGEEPVAEETAAAPEKMEENMEKKSDNRVWWIIWAVSFVVSLVVAVNVILVDSYSNPYSFVAIHPITVAAQISSLALSLGIVVLIIRFLCRIGKK